MGSGVVYTGLFTRSDPTQVVGGDKYVREGLDRFRPGLDDCEARELFVFVVQ